MMDTLRLAPALLLLLALAGPLAAPAAAQQRIAYLDSEYVLERVTEYRTAQAALDRLAQQWQTELAALRQEADALVRDFEARELLYTEEERQRQRDAIAAKEQEVESRRLQRFGPDGELFREQQRLMRPIQERVLNAVKEVAEAENYDYVFDKSGEYLFLYLRPQLDISDLVLDELGIEVGRAGG
jgi:outer membrane protein